MWRFRPLTPAHQIVTVLFLLYVCLQAHVGRGAHIRRSQMVLLVPVSSSTQGMAHGSVHLCWREARIATCGIFGSGWVCASVQAERACVKKRAGVQSVRGGMGVYPWGREVCGGVHTWGISLWSASPSERSCYTSSLEPGAEGFQPLRTEAQMNHHLQTIWG